MNKSFKISIALLPVMAFIIVLIAGIFAGHNVSTIFTRGIKAALITGILWGLTGYLSFSDKGEKGKIKQ